MNTSERIAQLKLFSEKYKLRDKSIMAGEMLVKVGKTGWSLTKRLYTYTKEKVNNHGK